MLCFDYVYRSWSSDGIKDCDFCSTHVKISKPFEAENMDKLENNE